MYFECNELRVIVKRFMNDEEGLYDSDHYD